MQRIKVVMGFSFSLFYDRHRKQKYEANSCGTNHIVIFRRLTTTWRTASLNHRLASCISIASMLSLAYLNHRSFLFLWPMWCDRRDWSDVTCLLATRSLVHPSNVSVFVSCYMIYIRAYIFGMCVTMCFSLLKMFYFTHNALQDRLSKPVLH